MQGLKETIVPLKGFCEQSPGDEEKITAHSSKCNLESNQLFMKASHLLLCQHCSLTLGDTQCSLDMSEGVFPANNCSGECF